MQRATVARRFGSRLCTNCTLGPKIPPRHRPLTGRLTGVSLYGVYVSVRMQTFGKRGSLDCRARAHTTDVWIFVYTGPKNAHTET